MADCLLKNWKQNKSTDILHKCGNYDVYSEINGPRQTKHHPEIPNKTGYLLDDGTFDFDGPGNRIFFPQHFRIQELHDAYPNATWILNLRDFESWMDSVIQWGTNDRLHEQFLNEYYMQGTIPSLPGNISAAKEIIKEIYYNHHKMVREFVQEHPSHALVEVNITHENAGEVLAEAFGLDPRAWMNINKNRRKEQSASPFDGFGFLASSLWWWLILIAMALCFAISSMPVVS